jgi:predicted dehydrogenase
MTPLILGTGRAGLAIAKSFAIVNILHPELNLQDAVWLKRGSTISEERKKYDRAILCIATPHALHASAILEGDRSKFDGILCEKPACVNSEQLQNLKQVKIPTAILHVYRQTWGLQTLKKLIDSKEIGDLITIEGRYWHPSLAERSLLSADKLFQTWKDDISLSGEYDTYLDLGIHWLDSVCYLVGSYTPVIQGWRSYINAASSHRDSHVQVSLNFENQHRAFGSISKTVHGSANHFELNVIGSKKYAKWEFLSADEILIGEGRNISILRRHNRELGSKQDPHHATGWLEGYIEIAYQLTQSIQKQSENYPTLKQNLQVLDAMFKTDWNDVLENPT